jgi:hypothetical protein
MPTPFFKVLGPVPGATHLEMVCFLYGVVVLVS